MLKKLWKNIKNLLVISIITLVLLELASIAILHLRNKNTNQAGGLNIFRQTTESGEIVPTQTYVLPVRDNLDISWSSPEFTVNVTTNSKGFRENFEFEHKDVDVAFFGDSFTFGHGVNNDGRYSYVFAQQPPFNDSVVVNYSYINGWEPEHYEYYIRNNKELHPKHLIVGLYLGNDLDADVEETEYDPGTNKLKLLERYIYKDGNLMNNPDVYRFPFNKLIGISSFVKLTLSKLNTNKSLRKYLFKEHKITNAPNRASLESGQEDLSQNRAMMSLRRIDSIVAARGGKFTVLLIPQNFLIAPGVKNPHINDSLKNKTEELRTGNNIKTAVISKFREWNIDYYDPTSTLSLENYLVLDGHWNASGHRIAGEGLARYLAQQNTADSTNTSK